ncbi:MAG: O-methyltransferase [uncultured Actinomycetospora sp.]|uniref:S-adenosyl-L-methionine-dependent methyltransferase n=1 Tax=uncultured Actinomycetospora sp. TaxID=1135996 RepID=A0A6J4I0S3_9PSEU|nr:MAG: O-methyltransferase [uncultured Actinomycetospora sp.]
MTADRSDWDIVSSVGLTALVVTAARALEDGRPDALVHDPWAARLVEAAQPPDPLPTGPGSPGADAPAWRTLADLLAVRSRFLDEAVRSARRDGVDQVVVLAAGLDVRAQRLEELAGSDVYEIDQPAVLDFKDDVLAGGDTNGDTAGARRHRVGTDLREDWPTALRDAGFDERRPALWLAEGLLPYLPADAEADLFEQVTALSAPGSQVATEYLVDVDTLLATPPLASASGVLGVDFGELWSREPREEPAERLPRLGWETEVETVGDAATRYGRDLGTDGDASVGRHSRLVLARRR